MWGWNKMHLPFYWKQHVLNPMLTISQWEICTFLMVRYHWSPIRHDWFSQLVWTATAMTNGLDILPVSDVILIGGQFTAINSHIESPRLVKFTSLPVALLVFIHIILWPIRYDWFSQLKTHHEFSRQVEDLSSHLFPLFTSWREKPKRKNHWLLKYS